RRDTMGCFFFSSRRRHTRFSRDWSSDVCSSDLSPGGAAPGGQRKEREPLEAREPYDAAAVAWRTGLPLPQVRYYAALYGEALGEIGRASCRERVEIPVVAGE